MGWISKVFKHINSMKFMKRMKIKLSGKRTYVKKKISQRTWKD